MITINTKDKIIIESMKLFSVYGFNSVSIRKIASEVGVTNSALYKHFKNKEAILDTIVEKSKEKLCHQYMQCSSQINDLESIKKTCLSMYKFQTEDEWIIMFRKLLIIEQFKNEKMAAIFKEFFIDIPIKSQTIIFKKLIKENIMKNNDAEVMATELYAPFFLYHTVNNKNSEALFKKHIENFFETYFIK